MSDLKEYLDLKKQYEKLNSVSVVFQEMDIPNTSKAATLNSLQRVDEILGWFLVRIDDLEKKANE